MYTLSCFMMGSEFVEARETFWKYAKEYGSITKKEIFQIFKPDFKTPPDGDKVKWKLGTLLKQGIKYDQNIEDGYYTVELPDPDIRPNENETVGNINDSGKRMSFGEGLAEREPTEGKGRYDLITPFGIRRLAIWYELGAKKYADRNWEKGMPFSRYIDAAKRHLDKYIMGMDDEDHLAAAAWNILSIMHHEELGQTEFDDLPHYLSKKDQNEITCSVLDVFQTLSKEEQKRVLEGFENVFKKEE